MSYAIVYLISFVAFLIIDFVGLSYLIKPIFSRDIGHLMIEDFRVVPAFLFYAFLIFVVMWFVGWPALEGDKSLLWVFGSAALIGAASYGTFEFTNYAILRDWTPTLVMVDLTWGTLVTGATAAIGVAATRAIGV
ncbi:DUF2177 family protein [Sulfitobacter guttiformis]|uniref:Putative membrane protein n=1 Tax=Sulfitobacter guttiformis TaxID=74349 RepID=A0A420DI60_9RHOB|nr:DUF2177 family protein [Sulfitobacter guttiformis]KIN72339.1 Membrane protein-like protein [Sulfitobacter guttiformis KCTC 32187]RKE93902.1 putative membrane protein [Sulfitobacter guttiformis]